MKAPTVKARITDLSSHYNRKNEKRNIGEATPTYSVHTTRNHKELLSGNFSFKCTERGVRREDVNYIHGLKVSPKDKRRILNWWKKEEKRIKKEEQK